MTQNLMIISRFHSKSCVSCATSAATMPSLTENITGVFMFSPFADKEFYCLRIHATEPLTT